MMTGQKEVEKCLVTWQVEGKGLQHQQRMLRVAYKKTPGTSVARRAILTKRLTSF